MPNFSRFLAFDTSTEQMTVALTDGVRVWQRSGAGGAQASVTLIPAILALLAEAGLGLGELDAIAFGRGPGSFTGLRTACAVAQGLALGANQGAGIAVLPIDTLLAVAEEARFQWLATKGPLAADSRFTVTALLDARMNELYLQRHELSHGGWTSRQHCTLIRPEELAPDDATDLFAGNVFGVYAARLPARLASFNRIEALPTASALLRLAPALAGAGQCVDAALALPRYVRDQVALTTAERAQVKAAASMAAGLATARSMGSLP